MKRNELSIVFFCSKAKKKSQVILKLHYEQDQCFFPRPEEREQERGINKLVAGKILYIIMN